MLAHKSIPNTRLISGISLLIIAAIIGYYIYLLHTGEAQKLLKSIQNLGFIGILIGVIVQSAANILPVPGEFISIILMEIYGPIWGGIFSWIGGLAGAVGALYLTKWVAKPIFGKMAQPFIKKVEEFINKYEIFGLLLIRFVPLVPYHFVNYAAGFLNVKLWNFIWTTGLGILPYTLAMSGIYAGVRRGSLMWGAIGLVVFILLFGISWMIQRKIGNKSKI
ncbi:TVP38/TMEM64 family protein [Paenibacillus alginolyticus]|uniref:TVP38/TMEM64 family membrane protein n=1 Tax=Paenibacillus alginolyticus TaxID=59839 RepID=A0ABT4GMD7_9BACL|nr:VTT domain-containing protein [Paenibacillus alginolyticus]MCY9697194.1 VTT domain-containing protein [Paenibacillus alginolyticus]MEC0145383.1 VTT domain-containing protein [Paenibacillus alginolyticus]